MSEIDIDINSYCFESKDVASSNFDTSYCSKNEIEEITIGFDIGKSQIYEDCKSELQSCKNDIVEEENIIENDEKENLQKDQNFQAILHWAIEKDWSINFDFWGKNLFFNPKDTNEKWISTCDDLKNISKEITITTCDGNYIIKDWIIYDWNKVKNHYIEKIDMVFWYSDKIKIHEALRKNLFTENKKYNFENFDKNVNFLSSLLFFGMAENIDNPVLKDEYLQESLGFYNLAYWKKEDIISLEKILYGKLL